VAARFILSLDCEGKWGVADHLTPRHQRDLTDQRLREAYEAILEILDEYRIEATFAFVGAFTQSPGDFARIRPAIDTLGRRAPGYIGPALRDIDESGGAGWHGHILVDAVKSARVDHELALHGVTHVPWTSVDVVFAEAEMQLFERLEGPVRGSRTFVFPRNLVAHADVLFRHGFEGFRTARPSHSRALSFLSEFNLFESPERPPRPGGIIHIPAGFFLNWRSGLRRLVPPAVTRTRAKRLLDAAAATGAIVHYWLHPENVASAPATLGLVRMLAREVARSREAGDCEVLTQLGYCRWVESLP
jgi:peptidoglycan/xylan/chitin deacetylase (PgdA/CDA1 family)